MCVALYLSFTDFCKYVTFLNLMQATRLKQVETGATKHWESEWVVCWGDCFIIGAASLKDSDVHKQGGRSLPHHEKCDHRVLLSHIKDHMIIMSQLCNLGKRPKNATHGWSHPFLHMTTLWKDLFWTKTSFPKPDQVFLSAKNQKCDKKTKGKLEQTACSHWDMKVKCCSCINRDVAGTTPTWVAKLWHHNNVIGQLHRRSASNSHYDAVWTPAWQNKINRCYTGSGTLR